MRHLDRRPRRALTGAGLLTLAFIAGLGCRPEADAPTPSLTPPDPASSTTPSEADGGPDEPLAIADPHLPHDDSRFAPSLTELGSGPAPTKGQDLLDAHSCGSCHEEIAAQWQGSAHAYASFNNPIYRASIDRFRDQEDGEARSQFCAGCHDPSLLVDDAMLEAVAADDPRAHVGVACRSCHGVESSRPDGNGSYVLASRPLPIPDMEDAQSIAAHRHAMGPARQACLSCHRAFVGIETGHPHHLGGTDEPGPWRDSSYAGNKLRLDTPVAERDCADCHMPVEVIPEGREDPAIDAETRELRTHRFLGGHSWLAAMRGDDETLARVQEFLQGVASLDIAAVELDGERHLLGRGLDADTKALGGARVQVDLVIRNLAVGHRFPGGTRDAQDTWLSLRAVDAEGRELAVLDEQSGEVHRLRTGVVDGEGRLISAREVEKIHAVAFDNTIGPRDAVVVRYALELPASLAAAGDGPIRLEARLLHRSRTLELADETCAESKTKRGRAFLKATAALLGERLDPCAELPVTTIATARVALDPAASSSDARPDHERLWELGMALYHQVQERLPEAREALAAAERALADAPDLSAEAREAAEARILAALGAVAARQGRVDEALALADRIAVLNPEHPYPHLLRGRALAKVWRWEQAVPHLQKAHEVSPESPKLAAELAIALGSAGDQRRALAVASAALELRPRDEDLLRAQALALRALDDPRADEALEAYFAHRKPDDQPHVAADCGRRDPSCARERVPVHVHE